MIIRNGRFVDHRGFRIYAYTLGQTSPGEYAQKEAEQKYDGGWVKIGKLIDISK